MHRILLVLVLLTFLLLANRSLHMSHITVINYALYKNIISIMQI